LPGDAMSNKFYGISSLKREQNILFLDSDIICLDDFSDKIFLHTNALKPADFSLKSPWEAIYKMADISFPIKKVTCTVDGLESPPYFNTGVIFIKADWKDELCKYWEEFFLHFSGDEILEKNYFNSFHRDQLAYALATQKLGIPVEVLDERVNFPARIREKIPPGTIFAHYHDYYTIAVHKILLDVFQEFLTEYPEFNTLISVSAHWNLLAKKRLRSLQLMKIYHTGFQKWKRIKSYFT
jgi:hypothetical protein